MTINNERKFLLWFIGILLSILSFIGVIGVNTLIGMNKSLNELKTIVSTQNAIHAEQQKALLFRVELLEKRK